VKIANNSVGSFNFGRMQWPRRPRVLLHSGIPVRLGSRAREILALLFGISGRPSHNTDPGSPDARLAHGRTLPSVVASLVGPEL
jgi:hypothetical protein